MCLIPRPSDADNSVGNEIEDEVCDLLGGLKMVTYGHNYYVVLRLVYYSIYNDI